MRKQRKQPWTTNRMKETMSGGSNRHQQHNIQHGGWDPIMKNIFFVLCVTRYTAYRMQTDNSGANTVAYRLGMH